MKQTSKRLFSGMLILCLMILCILPPSSSLAGGQIRYVLTENGKSLNVRDLPGKKGSVILRLANGSKVSVLDDQGEWTEIELDGRTGYVMAKFLTDGKPVSPDVSWTKASKTMYAGNRKQRPSASEKGCKQKISLSGSFCKRNGGPCFCTVRFLGKSQRGWTEWIYAAFLSEG